MKINITELTAIIETSYRKANYPANQIPIIVSVLTYALLRGNLQSLLQIAGPGIPAYHARGDIIITKDTKLSSLLDGNDNIGICVMQQATETVLDKAKQYGFSIAGSFNSAPPGTAALGYYVKQLAEQGFIAFAFSGSSKKVAPLGGYQPLFGTNPIAIGLPCNQKPIVIDMATSATALFKVLELQTQDKELPANIAYDQHGNITRNPEDILKNNGALTTFANDAKSYSLSLLVEILTGPLVGAAFTLTGDTKNNWGNLIYAFDPDLLIGREQFTEQMEKLKSDLKSSKCLPSVKEIFLPGEHSELTAMETEQRGWIEINDDLYKNLISNL